MQSRRAFLFHTSALLVVGCGGSAKEPAKSDDQLAPKPDGGVGIDAPPPEDLASLARSISGTVVTPSDGTYDDARLLYNTRFDDRRPAAIVYCASREDVATTLGWLRRNPKPFAIRSGGHSYAGYSSSDGIIVDVSRMNDVTLEGDIVSVGAGAKLIDLYATLAEKGLAVPAGSCPTVGVAGLALGGGIGPIGRKFGLTCDNLTAVELVTSTGDIVRCDATTNSDLFWACRGGGGGNFGVVTRLWFQTHPVPDATVFSFAWNIADAAKVLAAWQDWGPAAPDELFSICGLFTGGRLASGKKDVAFVTIYGFFLGDSAQLEAALAPLFVAAGMPEDRSVKTDRFLDSILAFANCESRTVAECHLAPTGKLGRETYAARSQLTRTKLSEGAIATLVAAIQKRQDDPALENGGVMFDAQQGAIARVPSDATAYVHRDALFSAQYLAEWNEGEPEAANLAWLNEVHDAMKPHLADGAYQNYIDPTLVDWRAAYYGTNYARLAEVKKHWDPDGFFTFAQGITRS